MRSVWLGLAAGALLCGQSIHTYVIDGLGDRIRGPQIDVRGDSRTETMQTLNGRSVPVERVEARGLRSEGELKVIERVIRRFDQTGAPIGVDRVVEEVTKLPGGSSSVRTSTYRGDVNGNLQLAERAATEIRKSGGTETVSSVIERPSIDGTFQVAEKQTVVTGQSPTRDVRNAVTYLRDENGHFYEASKEAAETTKSGAESVDNAARYLVGTSGRLELAEQTVRTAVKRPDGSESIVLDVYTQQTPGLANDSPTGKPRLKEQRVIERRVDRDGATEVVSLRQPSLADPGLLGPPRKVSESVCKGKCP
jgi:hypothetical protein